MEAVFLVIFRTVLFYLALVAVVRLMGKRQVGQLEPSEFVVTMLIANLAAVPLENVDMPISGGLLPMAIVFLCERLISTICLKSIRARRFLCGKPVILIDNGKLLSENLRRTRVNLDELSGHLREQGVISMDEVQFAILETNGSITVFPYPEGNRKQELPYTVISDGRILRENLHLCGQDEKWIRKKLHGKGLQPEQVLLMTVTPSGQCAVFPRE